MDETPGKVAEPFPRLLVPDLRALYGRMRVVFTLGRAQRRTAVDQVYRAVTHFVALCASEAFPAPGEIASTATSASPPIRKARTTELEMEIRNIDPRAMQVLRNLAMRALANSELNGIDIRLLIGSRLDRVVELPRPGDANEDDVYPPVSDLINFYIDWENSDYSRLRRCMITCNRTIQPFEVRDLAERVNPWYTALEQGGFLPPVGYPDEIDCARGSVSQFESNSVEISVDVMLGTENAWNPLMNIIDSWRRSGIPVIRVTVE